MAAATLLLLLPLLVDSLTQMSSTQLNNRALPEDLMDHNISSNIIAYGEWRTVEVDENVNQLDPKRGSQAVGVLARAGESRIVGGSAARFGAHPWGVAFVRGYSTIFCGGALIARDWVLTAAHCVYSRPTSSFKVRVGDTPDIRLTCRRGSGSGT